MPFYCTIHTLMFTVAVNFALTTAVVCRSEVIIFILALGQLSEKENSIAHLWVLGPRMT